MGDDAHRSGTAEADEAARKLATRSHSWTVATKRARRRHNTAAEQAEADEAARKVGDQKPVLSRSMDGARHNTAAEADEAAEQVLSTTGD